MKEKKVDQSVNAKEIIPKKADLAADTAVKILWRGNKYDTALKDTFNSIFINEDYCRTMPDPQRAALGYVATFIGNECWWDGAAKEDRSNLKCKLLSALNLGYQCSDQHLGFLRRWFRSDTTSLEELANCPTTPYTATVQETFDEISLTTKDNMITIWFRANGVNMREGTSWSWIETDHFQFDHDKIKLVKTEKSEVQQQHYENEE